jgi:hypothetical protein
MGWDGREVEGGRGRDGVEFGHEAEGGNVPAALVFGMANPLVGLERLRPARLAEKLSRSPDSTWWGNTRPKPAGAVKALSIKARNSETIEADGHRLGRQGKPRPFGLELAKLVV